MTDITHLRRQIRHFCLGMGTWQLGDSHRQFGAPNSWGQLDTARSATLLETAWQAGIRLLDTADVYGDGVAERRLGVFLRGVPRQEAVICTKWGFRPQAQLQQVVRDYSPAWAEQALEGSLKRLASPYLDIFLLHNPPPAALQNSALRQKLMALQQQGLIRAYGISAANPAAVAAACTHNFGAVIETAYNAYDRRVESLMAAHRQFIWLGRSPLGSGLLGQQRSQIPTYAADDFRSKLKNDDLQWRVAAAQRIQKTLQTDVSLAEAALRFSLSCAWLDCTLIGVKSSAQLQQLLQAAQRGALPARALQRIKQSVPEVFAGWRT